MKILIKITPYQKICTMDGSALYEFAQPLRHGQDVTQGEY